MNDDCDTGNCTRPVKDSPAIKGYRFMTGKLYVDNETLRKAIENDDAECITEYHSMWGEN